MNLPKASYIGDLFQVTLTRQEKGVLADKAKAEAGPSMMSLAAGGAGGAPKLPGLGGLTKLAGKLPGPMGMAAKMAGKIVQRGGATTEEGGSVTQAAFAAVVLGLSTIGGYSVYKTFKT